MLSWRPVPTTWGRAMGTPLLRHSITISSLHFRGFASSSSPRPRAPSKPTNSTVGRIKDQINGRIARINRDPKARRNVTIGLVGLYIVTAVLGFRYLYDTKYKSTGEKNPYRPVIEAGSDQEVDDDFVGIPPPADTTAIYEQSAEEYDNKIWMEELLSYIWLRRRKVMKQVQGHVLEASCGTGRNIKYLNPDVVSSIVFLDPSVSMLNVAKRKFDRRFPDYDNVQYVQGRVEDLDELTKASGQRFDTIFETFGLCSHQDPVLALKQFGRLLKPGGKIVLLEHGRSTNDSLNTKMDRIAARRFREWGCRWNLDIEAIVAESGLRVVESKRHDFGTTYYYVLEL